MSQGQEFDSTNPYQSPREAPHAPLDSGTARTAELLLQTRPWVRLMAILGFISVGLMVLIAGGMLVLAFAGSGGGMPLGQAIGMAVVYGLMGLLYIIPSYYLFRYASRIGTYLELGDVESLNFAIEAQKSFWKFMGIMMAAILCFYAIALVLGLLAMVTGMSN